MLFKSKFPFYNNTKFMPLFVVPKNILFLKSKSKFYVKKQ